MASELAAQLPLLLAAAALAVALWRLRGRRLPEVPVHLHTALRATFDL